MSKKDALSSESKANSKKKSEMVATVAVIPPSEEFKEKLQSLRDDLSLNIAMIDLKEKDMTLLGEILRSLTSITEFHAEENHGLFSWAAKAIHGIVSSTLVDEVEYHAGISTVLDLHKSLEEGFESFLYDGTMQESLKSRFISSMESIGIKDESVEQETSTAQTGNASDDSEIDEKTTDNQKSVIQEIGDATDTSTLTSFITDSLESVDTVESELMELENDPENKELVNSIFRCFHSVKGAAGFMGLSVLAELTHNAETALDKLRKDLLSADTDFIDCLLTVLDVVKQLLIQLKVLTDPDKAGSKILPVDIEEAENLLIYYTSDKPVPKPAARPKAQDKDKTVKKELADGKEIVKDKSVSVDVVKVPSPKLDELSELVGELVIALSILSQNEIISNIEEREVKDKINQMGKITESLRDKTFEVRMVSVESVFSRLTRQVRDLSKKLNKKVRLTTEGKETLVDKLVIDEIYSPLMHIVRNALDHGLEDEEDRVKSGKPADGGIVISAFHRGESIWVEVSDDGKGLDKEKIINKAKQSGLIKDSAGMTDSEIYDLIFQPGFSTAEKVTDVSGRGVGMDVVKRMLDSLRGKIVVTSELGKGSTFSLRLPMTTSIIEGLVVRIGEIQFITPLLAIRQTVKPKMSDLKSIHDRDGQCMLYQGQLIPILRLYEYFNIEPEFKDPSNALIIIVENGNSSHGLMVDDLLQKQQVVIKNIKDRFDDLKGVSGGTILGNGQVGFILDPDEIVKTMKEG
tara:strand:- start:7480 stop:9723 length:2244 start_codon:yes stop_codon:yes gene_type:complete